MKKVKPNFTKEYQKAVLNIIRNQAVIQDLEYWKKAIEQEFEEAKERYKQDPEEYGYENDDYGWDPNCDAWSILEGWDNNG